VLGDEYISQHILQGYHDYLEQTSYKVYMTDKASDLVAMLTGEESPTRWVEILDQLNEGLAYEKQKTETESEIKNRIFAKLNGKGDS
jgi:hypothetical protein